MKHEVRLEIELFNPICIYEKYTDKIEELFSKMLDDIESSNIYIKLDGVKHKIDVEMRELERETTRGYGLLVLYYEVGLDEIWNNEKILDHKGNVKKISKRNLYEYKMCDLRSESEKFIMDFAFAINLAYPGMFEFNSGRVFINDQEQELSRIGRTFIEWNYIYSYYLENRWPEIHVLNFEKVWKWLDEKTNYISSGMSTNAIERALNALSYTMGNPGYESMFYILIGLEAIYNNNKNIGIAEQLRTKTELLLKRPKEYKKKITKFYDNRSEFIHGNMNFPNSYYIYDGTKEFEEFIYEKYMDTVDNARAILISTIQEYIIQDANEMEIETTVKLK